jgi:hypothetical protein
MYSQKVDESDWRRFRELRELALERFCRRVLEEVEPIMHETARTYHERYDELCRTLKERARELHRTFDCLRRSRMIDQLAAMYTHHLVDATELAAFSAETRAAVERFTAVAD